MVAVTRKMNEFKDEILARIDEKVIALKTNILAELKDQVKNELSEVLKEEYRKRETEIDSICVSEACSSLSKSSE